MPLVLLCCSLDIRTIQLSATMRRKQVIIISLHLQGVQKKSVTLLLMAIHICRHKIHQKWKVWVFDKIQHKCCMIGTKLGGEIIEKMSLKSEVGNPL